MNVWTLGPVKICSPNEEGTSGLGSGEKHIRNVRWLCKTCYCGINHKLSDSHTVEQFYDVYTELWQMALWSVSWWMSSQKTKDQLDCYLSACYKKQCFNRYFRYFLRWSIFKKTSKNMYWYIFSVVFRQVLWKENSHLHYLLRISM